MLRYLDDVKNDPKSAVLLSGLPGRWLQRQAADGGGHHQRPGRARRRLPHPVKIKCEVKKFDLSAHADQDELLQFIRACEPQRVIIMHSDDREPMAEAIRQEGIKVLLPKTDEEFDL